jgi:hypothetical protein
MTLAGSPPRLRAPMGEIEKRIRGGKVRWVARYVDPDGRRRGETFDRKVDAQRGHGLTSGWPPKAT